eukprot:6492516-Amphidinium_carterae.1
MECTLQRKPRLALCMCLLSGKYMRSTLILSSVQRLDRAFPQSCLCWYRRKMLLACVGYCDGTMKAPKQFRASSGVQWRLKKPEWLIERLQQHHCPEEISATLRINQKRNVSSATSGTLLLRVEPGCVYSGPLTRWSRDEFFLFNYLFRPLDAFSLQVKAAVILEPAVNMDVDAAASVRKGSYIFDVSGSTFPNPNNIQIHSAGAQPVALSVAAVNKLLNLSPSDDWQTLHRSVVGLWMPDPLLFLMKQGAWAGLICQQRWLEGWRNTRLRQLFEPITFPHNAWLEQLRARNLLHANIPDETSSLQGYLNPASAASMAYTLRKHSTTILEAVAEDDLEDEQIKMESLVRYLDRVSQTTLPKGPQHVYDASRIILALLAAMLIRNVHELQTVVWAGLAAAAPHLSRSAIQQMLGACKLPSGATLSKKQLRVDAALCCYWQRRFAEQQFSIYVWGDSSPQAGSDYLITILELVKKDFLIEALGACHRLWTSVQALQEGAYRDDLPAIAEIAATRSDAASLLEQAVLIHRQVPAAIGSGAASVDAKARLIVHKFLVEAASVRKATQLLNDIVAVCTDMGTELAIPDISIGLRSI